MAVEGSPQVLLFDEAGKIALVGRFEFSAVLPQLGRNLDEPEFPVDARLVVDATGRVVALGSVNGTIKEVVDGMRDDGMAVGSVSICAFRRLVAVTCLTSISGWSASAS